jgi:hypothetical protein
MHRVALVCLCLAACEPERQLAVDPASLLDVAPRSSGPGLGVPATDPPGPTKEEARAERLRRDLHVANVWQKARELNAALDQEIEALESRFSPVPMETGP